MLSDILEPDFKPTISDYEHIFIDEAQFFTDLETSVLNIRKTHPHIDITCVGLDGDYQQNAFNDGQLLKLIPKSDNFIKLYSKCYKCNKRAPFTKRIINDSNQIIIGSVGVYVASCSKHL
jgi:thymidine kinase